jgi:hypothetical protein
MSSGAPLIVLHAASNGLETVVTASDDRGSESKIRLRHTSELIGDLNEARRVNSSWGCGHSQTEIRTKLASNGREMVGAQCLRCGNIAGNYIKKVDWPEWRPPWREDSCDSLKEELHRAEIAVYEKHLAIQCEEKRQYGIYLQSPQWRQKRQRVLERDNHRCQGCGQQRATQVHHRTYANIYREFLFELISVCDECHARIHDNEVAA